MSPKRPTPIHTYPPPSAFPALPRTPNGTEFPAPPPKSTYQEIVDKILLAQVRPQPGTALLSEANGEQSWAIRWSAVGGDEDEATLLCVWSDKLQRVISVRTEGVRSWKMEGGRAY